VCYVISGAFSQWRRRFYLVDHSAVDAAVNLAGSSIFMLSISESIKKFLTWPKWDCKDH